MPTNFSNIEEGESVTSASLNSKFEGVKDEINALEASAVQRNGMHHAHLPSMVTGVGTNTVGAALHVYTNNYEGTSGTTVLASGVRTGTGWAIVHDGTNELTTTFLNVNLGQDRGVLVLANVNVWDIKDATGAVQSNAFYAVFKIQVRDAVSSTWYDVNKSERFVAAELRTVTGGAQEGPKKDLAIRTFISSNDVSVSVVDAVRLLVATSAAGVSSAVANVEVTLYQGNISAIALYAGGS